MNSEGNEAMMGRIKKWNPMSSDELLFLTVFRQYLPCPKATSPTIMTIIRAATLVTMNTPCSFVVTLML